MRSHPTLAEMVEHLQREFWQIAKCSENKGLVSGILAYVLVGIAHPTFLGLQNPLIINHFSKRRVRSHRLQFLTQHF